MVSSGYRETRLDATTKRTQLLWGKHPDISILGPPLGPNRALIISFLIRGLHPNFVNALLNDAFGIQVSVATWRADGLQLTRVIQSRSGCFCAHQYVSGLLIPETTTSLGPDDMARIARCQRSLSPGATRVSFTWFDGDEHIEYILRAVLYIAEYGW